MLLGCFSSPDQSELRQDLSQSGDLGIVKGTGGEEAENESRAAEQCLRNEGQAVREIGDSGKDEAGDERADQPAESFETESDPAQGGDQKNCKTELGEETHP